MSTAGPAARFEDVRKRFGDFEAVKGISFEVAPGSLFGLLGSNGAGKTTSIRMLMNIFKPDSGRVEVLGQTMDEDLKPRVGYLPEERGLYKKMRVREMLAFFGRIKGRDDAWLAPRIDSWLERMGIGGWRDRRVEELSKGMSQKLQFVVTVLHGPELLVLDEPFAGLDPVNRDVLRDAVLDLHREGTTVLFSTHVMEQAEQLCDRLVMIHRGRVRLSGSLDEVRRQQGREAVHVAYRLRPGATLDDLPGVVSMTAMGQEAELQLAPDGETEPLLRALLERAEVRRFERKEPSLHEIFKRIAAEADAV
ncbi:MAG: ATP-binding cassette domain-containing protein [Planctomycetota bacterium]